MSQSVMNFLLMQKVCLGEKIKIDEQINWQIDHVKCKDIPNA